MSDSERPSTLQTSDPPAVLDINTPQAVSVNQAELLEQARAFLTSPLVADQPPHTKRRFLLEKGLSESQVDSLLRQNPPVVPAPTYPRPSPSALPTLLLGILRVFSYAIGISSTFLLVYYRFLLPRIVQTSRARLSLKQHQLELLHRLNTGIASLREHQEQAFTVLPKPLPYSEPAELSSCDRVAQLVEILDKTRPDVWRSNIPHVAFLRCAISELTLHSGEDRVATDLLFQWLEEHAGFHGDVDKEALWKTLHESPLFESVESDDADSPCWKFIPPLPPRPTALSESMNLLRGSLPPKPEKLPVASPGDRLLNSMTTLTGYLSASIYAPNRPMAAGGREEEVRKEIRALKGLSLNRKSFVPSRLASR